MFFGKMTIARVLDQIPDIVCGARHIMQKLQSDVCHLVGKPKLLIIFYEDSNCEAIFSNNPDGSQSSSDFHEGEFPWQNSTFSYKTFSRRRRSPSSVYPINAKRAVTWLTGDSRRMAIRATL